MAGWVSELVVPVGLVRYIFSVNGKHFVQFVIIVIIIIIFIIIIFIVIIDLQYKTAVYRTVEHMNVLC